MMYVTTAPESGKYTITSVEIATNQPAVIKYFNGYDFMGSVNWVDSMGNSMGMDPDEAYQVLSDLIAAN